MTVLMRFADCPSQRSAASRKIICWLGIFNIKVKIKALLRTSLKVVVVVLDMVNVEVSFARRKWAWRASIFY